MTPEELQALIDSWMPESAGTQTPSPPAPFRLGMAGRPQFSPPTVRGPVSRPVPPEPRKPLTLWERVAGVPSATLLTDEERKASQRGGIAGLLEGFLTGGPVGAVYGRRQGAIRGVGGIDALMQRRVAQAAQQRQQAFYDKYANANPSTPGVLDQMLFDAARTPGMEKTTSSLSEILKAIKGGSDGLYHGSAINPKTGKLEDYELAPGGTPRFYGAENVNPQPNIQEQRNFQRANQLSDDYRQDVKPWQVPYASLKRAMNNVEQAKKGNTAAQIQMLYAFINTLDNSVVREGEAHMFMNAAPVLEKARAYLNKYALNKGAVMPPGLVEEVGNILEQVNASFEARFDSIRRHYQALGKQWQVDPGSFIDVPGMYKADGTVKEAPKRKVEDYF